MKKIIGFALAASLPASASNFSYTSIDVSLAQVRLEDSLRFGGEIYDEFGLFSLAGSYQFNDNFALTLAASALGNEGPTTEISEAALVLGAAFPFAVSSRLDIVPAIGFMSVETESCQYRYCYTEDDSAMTYGLGLRLWAVPSAIEVTAGVADTTFEGSKPTASIGGALWLNRHSLRLGYSADQYARAGSVGYRYSW
jgi:hypothetical protein